MLFSQIRSQMIKNSLIQSNSRIHTIFYEDNFYYVYINHANTDEIYSCIALTENVECQVELCLIYTHV